MKKRFLALLLAMMFTMAACGGETVENNDSGTPVAGAQDETETAEDSIPEVQYVDGVPVFLMWVHGSNTIREYIEPSEMVLKSVSFWGYTIDPNEAVEKKLAEFVYDVLHNTNGTFIFNIGNEYSFFGATQEGKEDYNYNNISTKDLTIEDIQADLIRYAEAKEAEEDYDGTYTGEITLFTGNEKTYLRILFYVVDGVVSDKTVEFIGDGDITADFDYTNCWMRYRSNTIFEGSGTTEEDVLIDHSRDGLFTLDYDIEVLEQYGIDVTVNEIQWEEEYGASKLRINFTFTNNLNFEIGAQPREDIAFNESGEEINTFISWNEKIPAGESLTFDITVKDLGERFGSIEFAFDFKHGRKHITTDVFKMTDMANGMPTITFSEEMTKIDDGFFDED